MWFPRMTGTGICFFLFSFLFFHFAHNSQPERRLSFVKAAQKKKTKEQLVRKDPKNAWSSSICHFQRRPDYRYGQDNSKVEGERVFSKEEEESTRWCCVDKEWDE
jgi:hypothetical protein